MMLVDQKVQAVRERKFILVVGAGLMAIPLLGQCIALVVLCILAMQILSKSANRSKDLAILSGIAFLYMLAMFMAIFGADTLRAIPLLYFVPWWLVLLVEVAVVVWGRHGVRTAGMIALVFSLSAIVERLVTHSAGGMIQMAVMLFVVSYWGLSKMKEFIFPQ
jgi:hypothetical protein